MKTIAITLGLAAAACVARPQTSDSTGAATVDHYTYTAAGVPQLAAPPRDVFGRATSVGGATLTYAPGGALARATRGSDVIEYITDEAGHRLAKRLNGTVVEAYVDGAVVADTLYLPVRMNGATVGVIHHGAFESVATDARGSLLADGQGATAPAAFGERTRGSPLERVVDFAQSGRDSDLGTIRMGVRDYDPRSHQFLTPDPLFLAHPEKCIESPVECNLYSYARDRPADFIDPTGTEGKGVVSVGALFVGVEVIFDKNGNWSTKWEAGLVPTGFSAAWTNKDFHKSEIGAKVGYEARGQVGPLTVLSAKAEAKYTYGADGHKVTGELSGRILYTGGAVKVSSNDPTHPKLEGDIGLRRIDQGVFPGKDDNFEWKVDLKAGVRASVSVSTNSNDVHNFLENHRGWFNPYYWAFGHYRQ